MRKSFSSQLRLDCNPIESVELNIESRHEMIPVLAALQQVYANPKLRFSVTELIGLDLNATTRRDIGREGFSDWQVVVLAAVRLGCNLDYDQLQDLAENHRSLRGVLGVGDWDQSTHFGWRRIRDTLCMIRPETLQKLNHVIVSYGQELHGDARQEVRADSFVIEMNIHYPTESSLIWDGVKKIIPLCVALACAIGESGWRQAQQLQRRIKEKARVISQMSASKSPKAKEGLPRAYGNLLERTDELIRRAKALKTKAEEESSLPPTMEKVRQLQCWIELTEQVCDTARRRVLLGETVPNTEKLFSLFETHTQLYRRGKAGTPNQFGRLVLVFEDAAGFISHYNIMHRDAQDKDVIVEQTQITQNKHGGEIEKASFDRGFYAPENEEKLSLIIASPCLPPKHPKQYAEKLAGASVEFRQSRQRHPGIESAIGALQAGNGLKRCRDRSELGLERYVGLAILGRNLHTLGKLLIARQNGNSNAAISKRIAA